MQPSPEPSIGDLLHRLVDEGKGVAAAEARLYREIASYRIAKARGGVIALVAAVVLANAALIALMVAFVLGLAPLIGPVLSGLAVLATTLLVAFLLARFGISKLGVLSGDAEERRALANGETRA